MKRSRFNFLLFAAILSLLGFRPTMRPATATLPNAQVTGTVIGYDTSSTLLSVQTRLGAKSFLITNTTIILLNNHTSTANNIQANDQVTVTYDYTTFKAIEVHLFREVTQTGTVKAVGTTSITVHLSIGGQVALTTNTNSVINLDDIPIATTSVLVGRSVNVVYEPTSNLLLSLNAHSPLTKGTITAVNTTSKTVTVNGQVFTLDLNATILRAGQTAAITTLVVGDKARVAWVKNGSARTALAIQANPLSSP